MNISDIISLNINATKVTITIDQDFAMHGKIADSDMTSKETQELFNRLMALDNGVFYDPQKGIYYKGNISNIMTPHLRIFELFDITEIYNKYKKAKTDFESNQLDFLTNLPSRNKLDSDFLGYLSHTIQSNDEFAILMCDIDKFKDFNDTYGHVFGDHVLAKVAEVLKSSIRTDGIRRKDIIGRYGGEEFVIVLKNVTKVQTFSLLERIRINVEKTKINDVGVTISIGAFHSDDMMKSNIQNPISKEMLVELRDQMIVSADRALYVSKANGRNCSTIYDPSMDSVIGTVEEPHCKEKVLVFKSNS